MPARGGDLGGTGGSSSSKSYRWRRRAFIPQYLENVLHIYNVKKDKNERERR